MIPVSSSKAAKDPIKGSGGPWGLGGASSECPDPHPEGGTAALLLEGDHGLQTP